MRYEIHKIEDRNDLPEFGKYVLVFGTDKKTYNIPNWHVCMMDDCEDGYEYIENGYFHWLTENGTNIEDVTHWCELPELIKN